MHHGGVTVRRSRPCRARRNRAARMPARSAGRARATARALVIVADRRDRRVTTAAPAAGTASPSNVEPDELPRDAAVAAMQHADDHFLADVAALREADRARSRCRLRAESSPRPCRGRNAGTPASMRSVSAVAASSCRPRRRAASAAFERSQHARVRRTRRSRVRRCRSRA